MSPLNKTQSGYIASRTDTSLKNEAVSSCKETTDSIGHLVKQVPPIPSTLKQGLSSSSNDLSDRQMPFHNKFRLQSSGLSIIQINSSELSSKPASHMPELTSPGQHTLLTSPSARTNGPFYEPTPELMAKLIELAGIPFSDYPRQYPTVSICDTIYEGNHEKREQTKNTVKDIITLYDLLEDISFKNYLAAENLKEEIFDKNHFMWNIPSFLLEIVVQYTFQFDPVLRNISFSGIHGYTLSFLDHEILKVHQPVKTELLKESGKFKSIEVKYTCNEKPVIQQQATRGCTYAVAAMLMHQHNRHFSVNLLKLTNLGTDDFIINALSKAGLSPFKTRFSNIDELTHAVNQDGSAIVTVTIADGAHAVIVDAVKDTSVLIRDPYHGWEVEISRGAFEKSWERDAIQVK